MRILFLLALAPSLLAADPPRTMRLDFYHTGNAAQELLTVDKVVVEPLPWPGNPARPIDALNLGDYFFEVADAASKKVLYSRGFSSIYGEWVSTAEAKAANRTFHESLRFPTPEQPVTVTVRKRDAANAWKDVWTTTVDPKDPLVDTSVPDPPGEVIEIEKNGPPAEKVDLLILGDGYTVAERPKFETDAKRLVAHLFAASPFKERRKSFNVWGLCPPARESGVSRPSVGRHTANPVGATYDAFGSERYVLTFENKAFRRIAQFAPYDHVEILCNSRTYGGGGIFNLYGTVAADSAWAGYVFVHEFGHTFAALADEYYTSPVAYLPAARQVEPWQPNATAETDPAKVKWKDLLTAGTPAPTPWPKAEYETWSRDYQKRRAQIRKDRKPEAEMEALFAEDRRVTEKLLGSAKHFGQVGLFEGSHYAATGLYRPSMDCIMFSRAESFCPVCRRAIEHIIDLYATGP
jgi:IgA Peptidase M64/Peptidase M64 N-terminus